MHAEDVRDAGAASPAYVVLRRLMSLAPLDDREAALVLDLGRRRLMSAPGAQLHAEGAPINRPRVLLSGWAARCRVLPDGRRQIFTFLLPGDIFGFSLRPDPVSLSATVGLTRTVTADAGPLAQAALDRREEFPGLAAAAAAARALEVASVLDHVVRLGRQTAYERMAHLLLELHWRMTVVELGSDNRFPMPLTQEVLAEALGLSIVHVNRTLQQLRRAGLVEVRGGQVLLLNPDELIAVSAFRPPRAARRAPRAEPRPAPAFAR